MDDPADADLTRISDALNTLSEHFDSVQIFASRHEPETEQGTIAVAKGIGNWFARVGQVQEWLVKTNERSKAEARREE